MSKPSIYQSLSPKEEKKIPDDLNPNRPNQPGDWLTYRTRFTVRARLLSAPLSFIDALGREQNGKRGDYLVESNGMVTITARHIFEDVYVPLGSLQDPGLADGRELIANSSPRKSPISTKKSSFFPARNRRSL